MSCAEAHILPNFPVITPKGFEFNHSTQHPLLTDIPVIEEDYKDYLDAEEAIAARKQVCILFYFIKYLLHARKISLIHYCIFSRAV